MSKLSTASLFGGGSSPVRPRGPHPDDGPKVTNDCPFPCRRATTTNSLEYFSFATWDRVRSSSKNILLGRENSLCLARSAEVDPHLTESNE
jgi:hypothetical protein